MSYSQRAKQAKADRNFKIPAGRYKGPLKSFECKPNSNQLLMFTAGFMPAIIVSEDVKAQHPDLIEKIMAKKKEVKRYMTLHNPNSKFNPHAGFESQLIILADAGHDVDACRTLEQDPNYEDFKSLWHKMCAMSPMFTFDVKWKNEEDQYPEVIIIDVEPHPSTAQALAEQTAQMAAEIPTPPPADNGIPTPPAPAAPTYTGPTKTALRAQGWTDEQINQDPNYANAPEA